MKRIIIITVALLFGAHIEAQQLTEIYYYDETGVVLELYTHENGRDGVRDRAELRRPEAKAYGKMEGEKAVTSA